MPLSTCLCQITFPFSDLWHWGRRPSWFTECGWNKYSENARWVCTKLWPLKNPYTAGFRSRTNKEIIQIPSHSFLEVFSYHKMKLQSPNGLLPRCPICGSAFSGEDISFELITRSQQFLSQLIVKWTAHSSMGSYQLQLTAKHTQKKQRTAGLSKPGSAASLWRRAGAPQLILSPVQDRVFAHQELKIFTWLNANGCKPNTPCQLANHLHSSSLLYGCTFPLQSD